jgi:hypothetical protein
MTLVTLCALSRLPPGWARVLAVSAGGIVTCVGVGRIARFEPACRRVRLAAAGQAWVTGDTGDRMVPVSILESSLLSPRVGWLLVRDVGGRTWSLVLLPAGQAEAYRRFYVAWRWGRASGRV